MTEYISAQHRDNPGSGCAIPGFIEEIGRGSADGQVLFTEKLDEMLDLLGEPRANPNGGVHRATRSPVPHGWIGDALPRLRPVTPFGRDPQGWPSCRN